MVAERVREALRQVVDPEMGINVVDLGLIYAIETGDGGVRVTMTMTSPACPLGQFLKDSCEIAVRRQVPEAGAVTVALTFEPPWSAARMSEAARRQLGWPDPA